MPARLILHIGTAKTGTTALQRALEAARTPLSDLGVGMPHYADGNHAAMPLLGLDDTASRAYAQEVLGRDAHVERGRILADLKDAARNHPVVLASSEHLSSRLTHEGDLDRLREALAEFEDVRVIAYLRRQDRLVASVYATWVVSDAGAPPFQPLRMAGNAARFNYRRILRPWAAAFGRKNLVVRPYYDDAAMRQQLLGDFLRHALGISLAQHPGLAAGWGEANASPSAAQLAALRGDPPETADGDAPLVVSPEEAAAILDRYQEANDAVLARIPDLDAHRFYAGAPDAARRISSTLAMREELAGSRVSASGPRAAVSMGPEDVPPCAGPLPEAPTPDWPGRVGHVHLPKTAGTAVNRAIFRALGLTEQHLLAYGTADALAPQNLDPNRAILVGSTQEAQARCSLYLAGHLTMPEMRRLGRDFVFTVLRDPVGRVVSLYRYMQWRALHGESDSLDGSQPSYQSAAVQRSLEDYLGSGFATNRQIRRIMADTPEFRDLHRATDNFTIQDVEAARELVGAVLARYDAVFMSADTFRLQSALGATLGLPNLLLIRENETPSSIPRPDLGSRRVRAALQRATWADQVLVEVAAEVFPATVTP